jgi:predicted transcriptional regulator with HTH domain
MPEISALKKEKISEQILAYLFASSPESKFTSEIAREVARDEEFTKALLISLLKKSLLVQIKKNSSGKDYQRRIRWRLSSGAYEAYKNHLSKRQ